MSITFDQPRIIADFTPRGPITTRTTYRSASAKPEMRLTPRGRAAVVTVTLVVVSAVALLFGSAVVATDEAPTSGAVSTVTVQPGQTLWSIAAEARPDVDIRTTVDQIIRLNALENGAPLPIGATLAVPVSQD